MQQQQSPPSPSSMYYIIHIKKDRPCTRKLLYTLTAHLDILTGVPVRTVHIVCIICKLFARVVYVCDPHAVVVVVVVVVCSYNNSKVSA